MRKKYLIVLIIFLLLVFFTIDLMTPLGIGDAIWYVGILLLCLFARDKKFTTTFSILCILLTVAGYFLSPPEPVYIPFLNHFIAIINIIIVTFILIKTISYQEKEAEHVKKLELANKELKSFNFISSHDLQEPLRKIKTFAHLLLKEKNLSEEGKHYSERLIYSAERSQDLINDLLAYSRISKAARKFEKVNLDSIFEEVISNYKEGIENSRAIIKKEGLCEANIIPFQFRQLLENLISNSLKFVYPGRQPLITIKSEMVLGNKQNESQQKIKYCHIVYTDNGIGFEPKFNEKVFELFERLNHDKYTGTGIGLSICRKIVENHNGIISARGELNKGVRFDIYIPKEIK